MTEKHWMTLKEFFPETPAMLATAITIIFAGLLAVLVWHPIPPENRDAFMMGFGAVVILMKDTYARYLNSSQSTQDRTDQLIDLATQVEPKK